MWTEAELRRGNAKSTSPRWAVSGVVVTMGLLHVSEGSSVLQPPPAVCKILKVKHLECFRKRNLSVLGSRTI